MSADPVIVVCPLRFEARALRRRGVHRRATVACCGPGPAAVAAWGGRVSGAEPRVVLAGLAGSASARHAAGTAAVITEVRGAGGETWRPSLPAGREPAAPSCVLTQTAGVVRAAAERAALAERGVDLVDLESIAFARLAVARGWRWAIVRGVSDDAVSPLPAGVEGWVAADGRSRLGPAAAAILRRPALLPALARLRRDSAGALREVARLLEEMLEEMAV